jgi:hypothetical protein
MRALSGLACLAAQGWGQRQIVKNIAALQQGAWMMKGGSSFTWLGLGYGERSRHSKQKEGPKEVIFTGSIRTESFGKEAMKKIRRENLVPARYA